MDDNIVTITAPFVAFEPEAVLEEVHKVWGPDLDLQMLGQEYQDVLEFKELSSLKQLTIEKLVCHLAANKNFENLTLIFSRILAAKPHSADVERIISGNNILKTNFRNAFNLETENLYLFIHSNMPVLEKWDPRPSVIAWLNDKDRRSKLTPKARE